MSTRLRHYGTTFDSIYDCPVPMPKHWNELTGDVCSENDCWHEGLCSKCYKCPCHCKCPPPLPTYAEEFREQSRHYYESGRD